MPTVGASSDSGSSDGVTRRAFLRAGAGSSAALLATLAGCDVREFAYRHGAKRRLSIATSGTGGVYYVLGGGIARVISESVPDAEATAELTPGAVDNLKLLARDAVDMLLTTGDVLADAFAGREAFATIGPVPALALATLYPGYMYCVTLADRGITTLADLRGRIVSTNAPGNAAETLADRLLRVAGMDPERDIRRARLSVAESANALKEGKIDAYFGVSGIPNSALLGLASSVRPGALRLIPNAAALPELHRRYGAEVYSAAVIPANSYVGQTEDVPVIGVANLLVASRALADRLAHDIVRVIFARRDDLIAIHPEARHIDVAAAARSSPVPFHPGAVSYYREAGVWST